MFPGLTYFRGGDPTPYEGNLLRTEEVAAFLTSEDALALPDKIEVVRADSLFHTIDEEDHVAVLFYDDQVGRLKHFSDAHLRRFLCIQNLDSLHALQELELIDDEAVLFGYGIIYK